MSEYPMKRDLDGVYHRVERDGRWESVCFSDLTPDEMERVLEGRDEQWLRQMCVILGKTIRDIGDAMGIVFVGPDVTVPES